MREIKLPCYGIVVTLAGRGGGSVVHEPLKEECPHCGDPDCCLDCAKARAGLGTDDAEDAANRLQFNGAMDGITSMILARTCAGVDIQSSQYIEGIRTAVQACANNFA